MCILVWRQVLFHMYVMFFSVFECGNRVVSENIFYFCPILDTTVLHAINPALLLRRQSCVILQFDIKVNKQIRNNNYLVDNNQIGTTIINYCQIISSNWNHYLNSIIWTDYDEPKKTEEDPRDNLRNAKDASRDEQDRTG